MAFPIIAKKIYIPLLCLIFVYVLIVSAAYIFQRKLIYFPHPYIGHEILRKLPSLEKITLETSDGLKLFSYYKAPKMNDKGRTFPTILFMHGNADTAENAIYRLAPMMNAGYGVLALEYRGYSGNEGKPTEKGLIRDAEAAVDFIRQRQGEDASVIYYGMSLGTGVANGLAVKIPPVAMIQECGFSSLVDTARYHYGFLPVNLLIKDKYLSKKRIKSLKAPLFILHGEKDGVIPVKQGISIFEAACSTDKQIKLYPEGHHHDLYNYGAAVDILNWLDQKFSE